MDQRIQVSAKFTYVVFLFGFRIKNDSLEYNLIIKMKFSIIL